HPAIACRPTLLAAQVAPLWPVSSLFYRARHPLQLRLDLFDGRQAPPQWLGQGVAPELVAGHPHRLGCVAQRILDNDAVLPPAQDEPDRHLVIRVAPCGCAPSAAPAPARSPPG